MTDYNKLFAKYAPYFHLYESPISIPTRMAQLYVESKIFSSELALKSNNGFGIKASPPWTGKPTDHLSPEVGGAVVSGFRVYPSHEASIADHASFFTSTPKRENVHYKRAIEATTVEGEAGALTGVYAGDLQYGAKLLAAIKTYNLKQYEDPKWDTLRKGDKMAYIGIDIGHGKNSPARGGRGGWTGDEHSFNSKVAVRAKALIEALGHRVTFGAQNPNSNEICLAQRTNYFNSQRVDVLISIHANAHNNTTVNGISAFYDRYGRGRDSASLKLAKAIMNEYRKQGQVIWSTGEVPSYRGNWTDFHMNRESVMPSVLMELGFMTGNRDREYVFGSKQAQFVEDMAQGIASGVDKYFGGAGQTGSNYNPQGLKTIKIPPYKAPAMEFDKLEVGQEVTIRDPFNWYDDKNKVFMVSEREAEIVGTKDKIKAVKDIEPIGYSKRAYLLEGYNSWILEQDLVNARASWTKVDVPEVDDKDTVAEIDEGIFRLGDTWYKVEAMK